MGTGIKHPMPDWVRLSFVIFDICRRSQHQGDKKKQQQQGMFSIVYPLRLSSQKASINCIFHPQQITAANWYTWISGGNNYSRQTQVNQHNVRLSDIHKKLAEQSTGYLGTTGDLRCIFHLGLFCLATTTASSLDVAFTLTTRHYSPDSQQHRRFTLPNQLPLVASDFTHGWNSIILLWCRILDGEDTPWITETN